MTYEPLNRRLVIITTIFALLGVLLGAIALGTNYWTIRSEVELVQNGTSTVERPYGYTWNGLFQRCTTGRSCVGEFWSVTFIVGVLGLVFLLLGAIFCIFDVPKATDRHSVTPILIFVACVLMTAALVDYASSRLINLHSSRAMVAAVVFAYIALPLSAFIAGRYSTLERSVSTNNAVHLGTQRFSATSTNSH